MNNATSAAIGANLAELGNTAMRMFDPSTRAEAMLAGNKNALLAAQLSGQNIENQYRPGLFAGQTASANADAAARLAAAGYSNSQTAGQNIQNAGGEYMTSMLNKPQPTPVGLSQHDDAFYRIGNETGTDPRFLKAVAMFETGNGTSSAYRNKKNLMGASDDRGPLAFADPEESIRRIATTLARENGPYKGQNTIAGIGNIYAPLGAVNDPNHTNGGWSDGVSKYYTQLGGDPNTPVINRGGNPQSPTYSQSDLERMAVAANLFNKGGANDLMMGQARAAALSAGTEEAASRASLGITGKLPSAGENFTQARRDAYHAAQLNKDLDVELIKQTGAMQRDAFGYAFGKGGSGSSGAGTGGGASGDPLDARSFNDGTKIQETAADISKQVFKVVTDKDGNVTNDPFFKERMAYSQTVQNLMFDGKTATEAMAMASAHHFGGDPTIQPEDGILSNPSINWKNSGEIPRANGQGGGRMPTPFQMALLEQAGISIPDAFTMPPTDATPQTVGSSQPVAIPQTGIKDAFPRRQSSREKAAEDTKKKQISELEGRLRDVTRNLQTGNETVELPATSSAYGMVHGGGGKAIQSMDNDTYNKRRDEYLALTKQLKELKGGSVSPDAARLGSVVAKYTQ